MAAEAACVRNGAHLASVLSMEEKREIAQLCHAAECCTRKAHALSPVLSLNLSPACAQGSVSTTWPPRASGCGSTARPPTSQAAFPTACLPGTQENQTDKRTRRPTERTSIRRPTPGSRQARGTMMTSPNHEPLSAVNHLSHRRRRRRHARRATDRTPSWTARCRGPTRRRSACGLTAIWRLFIRLRTTRE